MTDFTTITTVNKNLDFEKMITENQSLRKNNEVLVLMVISTVVLFTSLYIYIINEQDKDQNKYKVVLN